MWGHFSSTTQNKERTLKALRVNTQVTYKCKPIRITENVSTKSLKLFKKLEKRAEQVLPGSEEGEEEMEGMGG
jgi:hypothetical protein